MVPIRIQRKRTKGSKMPPNTVSVTRPGPFGNPYVILGHVSGWWLVCGPGIGGAGIRCGNEEGARLVAIKRFREAWLHALECAQRDRTPPVPFGKPVYLGPLKGKNLACFCRLDQPCHADVLLELANREDEQC